ncbi:phosphomannomutase/phosphoglucomutase [Patescibacteria group bacterium]|nr:MAG: phosphomannomutase/phosphoglucomutase [Patescibacteria group bacterium]
MQLNPGIFKKYDLRGTYPKELTDAMAYEVGRGFAKYVNSKTIMIGYDARTSSPALKESLIKGITDQGVDVIDIGLCSTSCFYFTLAESGLEGGIMVTASHAPKEFNGFKPMLKDATPLTKEQVLDFKKATLENQSPIIEVTGKITTTDPTENYIATIRKSIKEKIKPLKVVMDSGNGTAGLYIDGVFADTGLSVISIFAEPDGNFPNHETNPRIPENRIKLKERIIQEKADLGFMFDGDADRLYVLDRNGDVIDPSLVLAIISEYLIKKSSKKKVVIEVRTSRVLSDWVKQAGGETIISTCWTIPIKLEMKANPEVAFGGETSGHYMFREMHESDDAVFGALTFLQAISIKEEPLDTIVENFKDHYFVMEEKNFKLDDRNKINPVLDSLKATYSALGGEIKEIDGLSVIFPDWWFNLRASETEPYLRLNFEANSKEVYDNEKLRLIETIEKLQ